MWKGALAFAACCAVSVCCSQSPLLLFGAPRALHLAGCAPAACCMLYCISGPNIPRSADGKRVKTEDKTIVVPTAAPLTQAQAHPLPRCLRHASPPFPIAPATPTAPAPTRSPCATLRCAADMIDAINGAQCSTAQRHAPSSSLPIELVGPVPARSSRTHCAFHAAAIAVAGRAGGSYGNGQACLAYERPRDQRCG